MLKNQLQTRDVKSVIDCKKRFVGKELFLLVFVYFLAAYYMKLAVFAAAPQETPAGKKNLRFYSLNDLFKVHYFLSI